MPWTRRLRHRRLILVGSCVNAFVAVSALAFAAGQEQPHHQVPAQHGETESPRPAHDMQHMQHEEQLPMAASREGSGTSWQPDETPVHALHREAGAWMLMAHGNLFVQYLHDSGTRGSSQAGSINWVMGEASRSAGRGRIEFRAMVSLEPWTIAGCGYPDLLASGETCDGRAIHDRQHPHDLLMELAATYDRPLGHGLHLQLYGGPAGEPALGPTAFPHRISAMPNPVAPITHHWLDSTHITYGVVTGGIYGMQWKAEASVFNGREPDERRTNVDFGPLDSWSARMWWVPSPRWALQVSVGRLTQAEQPSDGGPSVDVTRVTASATYHRALRPGSIWASTFGWGRNQEHGQDGTNGWLAETSIALDERNTWFGRVELSDKPGHDLGVESPTVFTVAKLEGGYTRYLRPWRALQPGVGGAVSVAVVPSTLERVYDSQVNPGVAVFLTVRPAGSRP
jgi:hypothetical protein